MRLDDQQYWNGHSTSVEAEMLASLQQTQQHNIQQLHHQKQLQQQQQQLQQQQQQQRQDTLLDRIHYLQNDLSRNTNRGDRGDHASVYTDDSSSEIDMSRSNQVGVFVYYSYRQ